MRHLVVLPIQLKEPWYLVVHTRHRGSFALPTCFNQVGVPGACAHGDTLVSNPSVTPVATGTTVVFHTDPGIRFQQVVDAELRVADLERRLRRLTRQLTPVPPRHAHRVRRSARSAWWPNA